MKDNRITVIDDRKRLGKSARLEQIFKKVKGDILFVIDADIVLRSNALLDTIIKEVDFKTAGLVGVNATPLPPATQFEKAVNAGVATMKDTAKHWNNGRNYLSYKGCFLGMDTAFARVLHLDKALVSNDAFLYFSAIARGLTPVYLEKTAVYYRSPAHFADHLKQSSRYRSIKLELQKYFPFAIQTEPKSVMFMSMFRIFIKEPIYLPAYLGVRVLTKLFREKKVKSRWDIAVSTKGVHA